MTQVHSPDGRVDELRDLVELGLRDVWGQIPAPLAALAEALDYSLLAPGKRVRPVLTLAAAGCFGIEATAVVDVAVAFELVHAYSLVHDDLPCMDDDELRRGMPTSHMRYGEGVAVLVGDALQAEAHRLVARSGAASPAQLLEIVGILAEASGWRGMVGGQYLDLLAGDHGTDVDALRELHDRKTGSLIAASLEAGAIVGGADASDRAAFGRFGRELGWLFQLVDDLLDEIGDSHLTGKSVGTDRRHGKITAIEVFGLNGVRMAVDSQLDLCLDIAAGLPAAGGLLPALARYVHSRDH